MDESLSTGDIPGILLLNRELNESALLGRVNEPFLEARLSSLDNFHGIPEFICWLTLARLTELTLWCAGGYADAGWFTEVGDLMFNPRKKYLARKHCSQLIELERHKPISDQVGGEEFLRSEIVKKLKNDFRLVIETRALLPELISRLKDHSIPSEGYRRQVESRMRKISSTLCFQSTINLPEGLEVEAYLRLIDGEEKRLMVSQLCRFNLSLFHQFGGWLKTNLSESLPESFDLGVEAAEANQQAA